MQCQRKKDQKSAHCSQDRRFDEIFLRLPGRGDEWSWDSQRYIERASPRVRVSLRHQITPLPNEPPKEVWVRRICARRDPEERIILRVILDVVTGVEGDIELLPGMKSLGRCRYAGNKSIGWTGHKCNRHREYRGHR